MALSGRRLAGLAGLGDVTQRLAVRLRAGLLAGLLSGVVRRGLVALLDVVRVRGLTLGRRGVGGGLVSLLAISALLRLGRGRRSRRALLLAGGREGRTADREAASAASAASIAPSFVSRARMSVLLSRFRSDMQFRR